MADSYNLKKWKRHSILPNILKMTSLYSGCFCLATTIMGAAYQLISPAVLFMCVPMNTDSSWLRGAFTYLLHGAESFLRS